MGHVQGHAGARRSAAGGHRRARKCSQVLSSAHRCGPSIQRAVHCCEEVMQHDLCPGGSGCVLSYDAVPASTAPVHTSATKHPAKKQHCKQCHMEVHGCSQWHGTVVVQASIGDCMLKNAQRMQHLEERSERGDRPGKTQDVRGSIVGGAANSESAHPLGQPRTECLRRHQLTSWQHWTGGSRGRWGWGVAQTGPDLHLAAWPALVLLLAQCWALLAPPRVQAGPVAGREERPAVWPAWGAASAPRGCEVVHAAAAAAATSRCRCHSRCPAPPARLQGQGQPGLRWVLFAGAAAAPRRQQAAQWPVHLGPRIPAAAVSAVACLAAVVQRGLAERQPDVAAAAAVHCQAQGPVAAPPAKELPVPTRQGRAPLAPRVPATSAGRERAAVRAGQA